MRNDFQLEIPNYENFFFDMALLGDTEREIGEEVTLAERAFQKYSGSLAVQGLDKELTV